MKLKEKINLKIRSIEGSPMIKYSKMKKNIFSLHNKINQRYINDVNDYENSFNINNNSPVLFLSNSSKNNYRNSENLAGHEKYTSTMTNTKDSFVDISPTNGLDKFSLIKKKINITNLEYNNPITDTFTNAEFALINNILYQLCLTSPNYRKTKKKYRLAEVNVNSFDFYDYYKDDFEKVKEEQLFKEAAFFIFSKTQFQKKTKKKNYHFEKIDFNNVFEEVLYKILRKVEIRKDNNELVSVEFIVNMIREEIDNNIINPIVFKNGKILNDFNLQELNNKSNILPPINLKSSLNSNDFDVISNKIKKKQNFVISENDENSNENESSNEHNYDNLDSE